MRASPHRLSLFSQSYDRAAFVAYLLGAVVPLLALAVVVQRFVLPKLTDSVAAGALVGAMVSIGALSLASFLVLRRTTHQALGRIETARSRAETLLETSAALSRALHAEEVAAGVVRCALKLAKTKSAFLIRWDGAGEPKPLAAAGQEWDELAASFRARIGETARLALEHGRPAAWQERGRRGHAPWRVAALPLVSDRSASDALVTVGKTQELRGDGDHLGSLSTLAALASVALHNAHLRAAQKNFFAHVTDMLVTALDQIQGSQPGHARRVAQLANRMGRSLGLDERRLERLHFASLLHDIGMLKLDPALSASPRVHRQHPVVGFRMLERIQLWNDIAPFVLHHHEWFDGRGYPEGIRGEAIPLESRIIALAEAFDSMTSRTSYQPAVSREEALRRVRRAAGTQFDPEVVRVFLELADEGALPDPNAS